MISLHVKYRKQLQTETGSVYILQNGLYEDINYCIIFP